MKLKMIHTPDLRQAYEVSGPARGETIMLLHGWPDSARTWDAVLPRLHAAGYETVAPYIRGFAPTEFRDRWLGRSPRRTGQPVAYARDMIELADRLGLKRFHYIGHDWGARAGYVLAALFPRRLKSLVALGVTFVPGRPAPPKFPQDRAYWYQWLLCTRVGEEKFRADPVAFCREQWDTWSPPGWYTEEDFAAAARSWQGEDFVEVVLHGYRSRWGHAEMDPAYARMQHAFEAAEVLRVPTAVVHGRQDACLLTETTDGAERYFSSGYRRVLVEGAGHFPQRERPAEVAEVIVEHLRRNRE